MDYFQLDQIKQAYVKLRSYIYHDNTDLYLRQQLVEFETGITKDRFPKNFINYHDDGSYGRKRITVEGKLEKLALNLQNYHNDKSFFTGLINKTGINFYPKSLSSSSIPHESNFITNKKSKEKYLVERVTPFIDAPIELHIISVLWIMQNGVELDSKLGDECFGNRLILNKDRSEVIQGSGLFKPYFNQYKRWRDNALQHAKQLLNSGRDVAFVNLDIKEYFSSVRLPKTEIHDFSKVNSESPFYNLERIFLAFHEHYTNIFSKYQDLGDKEEDRNYVLLPIGLVSSYVLANYFLEKFDNNINRHVKPVYYGRYVDDLLFVVADPVHPEELEDDEFVSSNLNADLTLLEKFIVENFSPILSVEDSISVKKSNFKERRIQLNGSRYKSLYCQSSKSLIYLFDAQESHLVIDKLKEELNERTSEFRDFPDDEESSGNFTDAAYHLQYEDSKDKVRTLKDYKEDRFGLTLYLANKIFSSLRQEEQLSDEECESILKFFRNKTAIEFYRLWERIFTLFLVNNRPKYYVAFYLQCVQEIDKLKTESRLKHTNRTLKRSMSDYLDVANEITFSLNLSFYDKAFEAAREFEFKTEEWNADIFFSINNYLPTKADAYWKKRFRRANMMRHHYIIHPLLNYTIASHKASIKNLVNPHIDFTKYRLDDDLLKNSPRRVKFSECNMAQIFVELNKEIDFGTEEIKTNIFSLNQDSNNTDEFLGIIDYDNEESHCLLNKAFSLFHKINEKHIPSYELKTGGKATKEMIVSIESITKSNSPTVWLNEIKLGSTISQDKFKIAFANTNVTESNILRGIRGKANLSSDRIQKLGDVIRSARKENADIILFPEFFIPIDLLSSVVDYARKNEKMVVTGLEHIAIGNYAYNFIVTIVPTNIGGVKDAIIIPRLKNHYAHAEQHIIEGNHKKVPKPMVYRYDLFIWKNLYFSPYYCFELANIHHRGLWKNKIDLMIGVEWNKDTPYYSNIVEATSRDLHCFFAQVNTSQFGDSRLTKPVESALKDILRLKGGENDALLVASLGTKELREFQRQTFSLTHAKKEFKPLPPDFDPSLVLKRINGESVIFG